MQVDPNFTSEQVRAAAADEVEKILKYHPNVVMCQGEMTLLFNIITILKANGVSVVAATSERKVSETHNPDGTTQKIYCLSSFSLESIKATPHKERL